MQIKSVLCDCKIVYHCACRRTIHFEIFECMHPHSQLLLLPNISKIFLEPTDVLGTQKPNKKQSWYYTRKIQLTLEVWIYLAWYKPIQWFWIRCKMLIPIKRNNTIATETLYDYYVTLDYQRTFDVKNSTNTGLAGINIRFRNRIYSDLGRKSQYFHNFSLNKLNWVHLSTHSRTIFRTIYWTVLCIWSPWSFIKTLC